MMEKLYLWLTREITIYRSFWLYWILLLVIAFFVAGIAYTDDGNKCSECDSTEYKLFARVYALTMPGCQCSTWVCDNGHKWTTHKRDNIYNEYVPWPTPASEIIEATSIWIQRLVTPSPSKEAVIDTLRDRIEIELDRLENCVTVTSFDSLKDVRVRRTFQFQDGKMVCIKKEELTTILKWVEVE